MSAPPPPPPQQQPLFLRLDEIQQNSPPSSFPEPSRGSTTWHTLLTAPATPSDSLTAGVATCPPGGSLAPHRHAQAEVYYVLSGSGEVEVEGRRRRVGEGTVVWIPGDAEHGVFCGRGSGGGLKWLYVFPEGRMEDVVYRFRGEEGWGRE